MKHIKITITGQVQGVWFRQNTAEEAQRLGLVGTVQNLADGNVEIHAQGDEEDLKQLLLWCEVGPPNAEVENVKYSFEKPQEYQGFQII